MHCNINSPVAGGTLSSAKLLSRCSVHHKRAGRAHGHGERTRCQAASAGRQSWKTRSARLAFQLTVHSPSLLGTIDQSACMDAAHLSVGLIVQKPSKGPQQTLYCTKLPAKQKACLKKCASMAEPLGVVLARLVDIFVTQLMTKTAWH